MSASPHLGLGYLAPSQAQKHVTVNEAFRRLDAIVQLGVLDRDLATPPSSPAEGDRHIVPAGATGAWAGQGGRVAAFLDGEWVFIEPKPGWLAYVAAEGVIVAYGSGVWSGSLASLETIAKLGVNATADTVNRLAVSSAAALFNHAGAGVQVKLNKASAADVASFLFQRGFSGRAEFGLVGSDGFSLKVSADGSVWTTALSVEPATGAVSLPATPTLKVDKFTASGTWTKPAWASRVVVELVGGGHGGGSGGVRASGVAVSGGSGAAPAAMQMMEFSAADLSATVAVTVGAGGAGGASQSTSDSDGLVGSLGGNSSFGSYLATSSTSGARGGGGVSGSTIAGGSMDSGRFLPGMIGSLTGGAGNSTAGGSGSVGAGRYSAGAGGGGGLNSSNAAGAGGASGENRRGTNTNRIIASDTAGSPPGAAYLAVGDSGGGGSASATANSGPSGAGAVPGGSGGGGGAARNGFSSGKGGDGARGEVWVTSYR